MMRRWLLIVGVLIFMAGVLAVEFWWYLLLAINIATATLAININPLKPCLFS